MKFIIAFALFVACATETFALPPGCVTHPSNVERHSVQIVDLSGSYFPYEVGSNCLSKLYHPTEVGSSCGSCGKCPTCRQQYYTGYPRKSCGNCGNCPHCLSSYGYPYPRPY